MKSLESELADARALDEGALADAIESIGFECTRCGACCKSEAPSASEDASGEFGEPRASDDADPHTATVFPDEIRDLQGAGDYDFRDVARPMPYGLVDGADGPSGETFEWALRTDACGDCAFYAEDEDGLGACTVHEDRPLICETYPFSLGRVDEHQHGEDSAIGTSEPMGGVVEQEGSVRAHECEGLGREISRKDAEELAEALKERAIRELEEAIGVVSNYEHTDVDGVVVHDSEGQKRPDGTLLDDSE